MYSFYNNPAPILLLLKSLIFINFAEERIHMQLNTRHYFSLILLLLGATGIPAQNPATQKEEIIELQVMLSDNVKDMPLPPYCGIYMTDQVVNFKVMKVIHGFYLKNTVRIHINCLREAVESKGIDNHVTYVYKLKAVDPATTDKDKITYTIVL